MRYVVQIRVDRASGRLSPGMNLHLTAGLIGPILGDNPDEFLRRAISGTGVRIDAAVITGISLHLFAKSRAQHGRGRQADPRALPVDRCGARRANVLRLGAALDHRGRLSVGWGHR